MKLYTIKSNYGFHQTTFYQWLREMGLIERQDSGYVVGPNALEGMATFWDKRVNREGELTEISQVTVEDTQIPQLVEMYLNSGKEKLYSRERNRGKLKKEVEELQKQFAQAEKRIEVLENQLITLTNQLTIATAQT